MVQVYNYMLESYPMKREIMYPAHKRSELKKVYNSIVNLSKQSPLYKINLSKENQEYTIGVKESALYLKAKLEEMAKPDISGFDTKAVSVSDDRVLSATLLDQSTQGLPAAITFQVDSVASVQVNAGKELFDTSKGFPPGAYRFRAKVGDRTYSLNYVQEDRTVNRDAISRLADYLNNAVTGINASVEQGSAREYSRLTIVSDQAGKYGEKAMSFFDEDDYGVVDYFGLNRTEQESQAATFTINGVDKQTSSNTFHLENKLEITLKDTSSEPVTVKIVPDSSQILAAVEKVTESFNSLIEIAQNRTTGNKEHYRASKLISEMKSMEKVYSEELEACGITSDEQGFLRINDSLAIGAAEDGGMESLFTRENGFITRLIEKSESIAINPMEYLDKTIVTYPNTEEKTYRNPYVTSMYSGLFFSSYC